MPVIPNMETAWPLRVYSAHWPRTGLHSSPYLERSRWLPELLAHLTVMKTEKIRGSSANMTTLSLVDGVLYLSELCAQLQVSAQTIYDLRSQGRGPRGFRVGRELRFRNSEIDGWLRRLENEDDRRHQLGVLITRPRTPVGAYGSIAVRGRGDRVIAETGIRDADGRLRHVRVSSRTAAQARQVLKERLLDRPTFGSTRVLTPQSSFADLAEVWLADLAIQRLAERTKQNYRDQVRQHVRPAFEQYTLAEITTGRVEWFLKPQAAISSSRARQSRTLLNLLLGFALRHDAVSRNPVAGTSPLPHPEEPAEGPHA